MTIQALLRLSPRALRGTTLIAASTRRTALGAAGAIGQEEFWGLVADIATGQAHQSTAATGAAVGASATIQTRQGSQSTAAVGGVASDGPITTSQGGQSSDAVGALGAFQQIKPAGFYDAALTVTFEFTGYVPENPRVMQDAVAGALIARTSDSASAAVKADAIFTAFSEVIYSDGFGTPSVAAPVQTITVSGINQSGIGSPSVVNVDSFILPSGIAAGGIGSATAALFIRYLTPTGSSFGTIGTAAVTHGAGGVQTVIPTALAAFKGFGFGADGAGFISYLDRHLNPVPGISQAAFGAQLVSNIDRFVTPSGLAATSYGTQFIAYKLRELTPPFIPATSYGRPVVDQTHFVDPTAINDGAIGQAFVHDLTQTAPVQGLAAGALGTVVVSRSPRVLAPVGFPSSREVLPDERWGRPEVHSNRQYIAPFLDTTVPGEGGVFGDPIWTLVENRNRAIAPVGWRDDKVQRVFDVRNNAVAAAPASIDDGAFGQQLVAYYIRHLPLPSIDPGDFGPWAVVFNNARLVAPAGPDTSSFGLPTVENTRRYFDHIGGFDDTAIGTAMVADRVRFVTTLLGVEGAAGTPMVMNVDAYATPPSFNGYGAEQFGGPTLEIHFNIAAARSILPTEVVSNEATVLNRNRAPMPYGYDMAEWGRPTVFNFIQSLPAGAIDFGAIGPLTVVEYRTKTIAAHGVAAPAISVFHRAAKTTPDPPAEQKVFPDGLVNLYGTPTVRTNVLQPDGLDAARYGTPTVRANSIRPQGFRSFGVAFTSEDTRFGDVRTNFTQFVTPDGLLAPDDPLSPEPKPLPRLSPFTIYCTISGKPDGYTPGGPPWRLVDDHLIPSGQDGWPIWGVPAVTLKNRRVLAVATDFNLVGQPQVDLKRRVLDVVGLNAFRTGYPSTNYPQTVVQEDEDPAVNTPAFGDTVVTHYIDPTIPRTLRPSGFSTAFGTQRVELFNRALPLTGWDSFTMSAPAPYSGPAVFGPLSTRVHFPEPVRPAGIVGAFGATTIWFRVRELEPEGFESFVEGFEATPQFIGERMRVTQRGYIRPPSVPSSSASGTPTVSNRTRTLGPDPANRQAQFGNARARYQAIVSLAGLGIDSLEMGTPEKWQAGDAVRTWGADHSGHGTPRIDRRVTGTGLAASSFGAAVIGPYVRVAGFADDAFGVPTMSYADGTDFVCGLRPRALPPQGFNQGAFGAATVA